MSVSHATGKLSEVLSKISETTKFDNIVKSLEGEEEVSTAIKNFRKLDPIKDADIISVVKKLRQSLPSDYKKSGNFALAETMIEGLEQKNILHIVR